MQFEPLPEKRAVPAFVKKIPAQSVVLELMKADAAERGTFQQKIEAERKRADSLATALALQVYRKRGSDDPFVRALSGLLAEYKVEAVTYEGKPLSPELETAADIVEWLPAGDNDTECVAEAIEPEIRYQGRILHRAKLSCRKAPEPEPEVIEPETEIAGAEQAEGECLTAEDAAKATAEETGTAQVPAEIDAGQELPQEPVIAAEPPTMPEPEKSEKMAWLQAILKKLVSGWKKPKVKQAEPTEAIQPAGLEDTDSEKEGSDRT